ncbi:MAG TPA: NAD(P)H-hydrate dehydratase [Caulobacteraceae bacterium]|nr:NAD(P)H-hydrate dehydratase [Caulobacteraceae bacterium]
MSRAEILTTAQTRAADAQAIAAGTAGLTLMTRAGRAVAGAVMARWPSGPVVVLCGPGSNGGDGFVAACALKAEGREVRLACMVDRSALKGDAALAAGEWTGPIERLGARLFDGAAVIVDALFGAGLDRPLESGLQSLLRAAGRCGAPILAVDLPSGLNGDTGQPMGYAPPVAATVTFHRKKPAHVLLPGRDLCGEILVVDIGLPPPTEARLVENGPWLWGARMPWPTTASHKHARGSVIVVSGEASSTGAARLAARAALRIGAGLVTVLSPPDALTVNGAHLEAVMLRPFETDIELEAAAAAVDAAVIGPAAGVNESTVSNLFALARTGAGLVIDADALTVFADEPEEMFSVLDRDDVLTPHPGEFERVFPGLLAAGPERITAARRAAERAGTVVLLKGSDTVIAAPDGRAVVNGNGSPWLATAGAGDVLAGFVSGLIAQGMDSFDAACAAVWIHAEAASEFGPGLISEDLPGLAPRVLAKLYAGSGVKAV